MTNSDQILELIQREPGLTDSEIVQRTGIEPHQQVNGICLKLAKSGRTKRVRGPHGRLVNVPIGASTPTSTQLIDPANRQTVPTARRPALAGQQQRPIVPLGEIRNLDASHTLLIIPGSGKKAHGGVPNARGHSIAEHLTDSTGRSLRDARTAISCDASRDDRLLLPAWRRYRGRLYRELEIELERRIEDGAHILILSGGYGVLMAEEEIGTYDLLFSRSRWPRGLIASCLVEYARAHELSAVVAFVARTTAYADVVRRTRWSEAGVTSAYLVSPKLDGRRGAQSLVPRALGESLGALWRHELHDGWLSSDGVPLDVEPLE